MALALDLLLEHGPIVRIKLNAMLKVWRRR
jgi:hypothetical protein